MGVSNINRKKSAMLGMLLASSILAGCAQTHSLDVIENPGSKFYGMPDTVGDVFQHQQGPGNTFTSSKDCSDVQQFGAHLNYRADKPITLSTPYQSPLPVYEDNFRKSLPLSPGDLVEVYMEFGEGFNGRYVIDNAGLIHLPVIAPLNAAGTSTKRLSEQIELSLVRAKVFLPQTAGVTVKVLNWSSIEVPVTGAVFQPGRVTINVQRPSAVMEERIAANGDYTNKRLLSEAIRAASGIRPDAKLDQVMLIRGGWQIEVDLTGILTGQPVTDYPLIAGDQVIVPSTGCFQPHLVRPSQITPKGFRVFMSNLVDSAQNNSAAAVGRYSTNIPYGTRLLQAAVSANCVGGKEWTNAPRKIVLASKNPITGQTQVIQRSVEQLVRQSNRDDVNPYLMPSDAVACYDSDVTNLRDVAGTLLDILAPFTLL